MVQEIDTTNALAVLLLLIGMFAAVRAAMHTRTGGAKNADDDRN